MGGRLIIKSRHCTVVVTLEDSPQSGGSHTWQRLAGKSAFVIKISCASSLLSTSLNRRNAQQMSNNCTNMALHNCDA